AIIKLNFISLGLRILRFPIFLSTLKFKLSKKIKTKFYLTPELFVPRYALAFPVSVGSHYREIRKQINPFLKKT
ncbi:hypothetical protein CXF75_02840, partial [Pseudoalteromonas arctica]